MSIRYIRILLWKAHTNARGLVLNMRANSDKRKIYNLPDIWSHKRVLNIIHRCLTLALRMALPIKDLNKCSEWGPKEFLRICSLGKLPIKVTSECRRVPERAVYHAWPEVNTRYTRSDRIDMVSSMDYVVLILSIVLTVHILCLQSVRTYCSAKVWSEMWQFGYLNIWFVFKIQVAGT